MVLKIRLARFGKRNAPFYNIVVAQARSARNSKPLEVLGTYDPIPKPPPASSSASAEAEKKVKDIKLDISRAKYWLGVGAQPSDPAWRLLSMVSGFFCCDSLAYIVLIRNGRLGCWSLNTVLRQKRMIRKSKFDEEERRRRS